MFLHKCFIFFLILSNLILGAEYLNIKYRELCSVSFKLKLERGYQNSSENSDIIVWKRSLWFMIVCMATTEIHHNSVGWDTLEESVKNNKFFLSIIFLVIKNVWTLRFIFDYFLVHLSSLHQFKYQRTYFSKSWLYLWQRKSICPRSFKYRVDASKEIFCEQFCYNAFVFNW